MEALNDNDEFSFITLGAATANVVRYLEGSEKHQEDREREAQRNREQEKKKEEERAYIEQRLRDIAAFENGSGLERLPDGRGIIELRDCIASRM
jgi:hypothetical protein